MPEKQAPELGFKRVDDETTEVYVKGEYIGTFTYTEMGWSGMEAVERLLTDLAEAVGMPVVEIASDDDEDEEG